MTADGVDPVLEPQSLRDEVAEILSAAEGRVTIGAIRERLRHYTATPSQLIDALDELVGSGSADRFSEAGARALYQWVSSKPVRLPPPPVRVRSEVLVATAATSPAVYGPIAKPHGTQRRVVDLLKDGQARPAREIALALDIPQDRVSVALSNLKSAGKVTRDTAYPASFSLAIGADLKPPQQTRTAAIYDFIRGAGRPVRSCEISKAISMSNSNVWSRLQFLIANGMVKRTDDSRYVTGDGTPAVVVEAPTTIVDMPRKLALLSELGSLMNPKIAELLHDIRRDLQRFGKAAS